MYIILRESTDHANILPGENYQQWRRRVVYKVTKCIVCYNLTTADHVSCGNNKCYEAMRKIIHGTSWVSTYEKIKQEGYNVFRRGA